MERSRGRARVALAAVTLLIGALVVVAVGAPSASADVIQSNGCLGTTGTIGTFPIPLTGTANASPGTANPGSATYGVDTVSLDGLSVTIGVDAVLVGAGISTGLVTAAPDLASIGVEKINNPADGGTTADANGGISAATVAPGKVSLSITGVNTVESSPQIATNMNTEGSTFYVTGDPAGGNIHIYTSVTNPSGGYDPTRTGTELVGALPILVPLGGHKVAGVPTAGSTVWTPSGALPVSFKETSVVPSNLLATALAASGADQAAAPLTIFSKINGSVNVNFWCWTGSGAVAPAVSALIPAAPSSIASIAVVAPATAPACASPQATSVGGGQSVTVTPSCTDVNSNFTPSDTSIAVTTPPAHGTATVTPSGTITYSNDGLGASSDTFQYQATDASALAGNLVTVNVAVLNNQCTVSGADCSLKQVLVLPVLPSTLSMTEGHTTAGNPAGGDYGNPSFSQAYLAGHVVGTTCVPGPVTLNGGAQTACGALNSVTVVNARGTDAKWDLTGQVSDFIDGTRGPTDTCSPPTANNIAQSPKNNHCIPGDNLGWVPMANITDAWVPGDTAAVNAGSVMLSSQPVAQVQVAFPPSIVGVRQNVNGVGAPFGLPGFPTPAPGAGLHDAATQLCGAPVNQSGGTFQCDAGLLLAVPGSAAAGTYLATLTLTLA